MSTVNIDFKPLEKGQNQVKIVYRISHNRTRALIQTDYIVKVNNPATPDLNMSSKAIKRNVNNDVERLYSIIREYDSGGMIYSAKDIAVEFQQYMTDYTIVNFMTQQINRLKLRGKQRTAETYTAALSSFRKYLGNNDIHLKNLTSDIIEDYETYLNKRGLVPNSVSFYMRILRAVYNRAVDEDAIEQAMPFRHVYTGIDQTVKRALPLSSMRKISDLDLSRQPDLAYARDLFLLSFYLRGMSFIDMAFLRKSDLHGNNLSYRRHKTGKLLSVKWTKEMQSIVNRYSKGRSEYLLPILQTDSDNSRIAYKNISYNINRKLKIIARMAKIDIPLTFYCARHTWASIAHSEGIPITIISEGMGHRSENTTRIYLASLDSSTIDKANRSIIKLLHR